MGPGNGSPDCAINGLRDFDLLAADVALNNLPEMERPMLVRTKECSNNSSPIRGRFFKLLDGWPAAIIVLALAFTVAWVGFLFWLVLRVLHLI